MGLARHRHRHTLTRTHTFPHLQVWLAALAALSPNPTDSCPLYLNHATVAALPARVSRHNSPSSAHFVSRLVRSCLPGGNNRCIVVRLPTFTGPVIIFILKATYYTTSMTVTSRCKTANNG